MKNLSLVIKNKNINNYMQFKRIKKITLSIGSLIDAIFAAILLPFAGIIIAVIYVLHKLYNDDKGPFIYSGDRIGKGKEKFKIYKIRTLYSTAESACADKVLDPKDGLELKFGKFLRKTRLDELPQLINILKGDMAFIGPRPVRQSIYDKHKEYIFDYENRFEVKPGLLGFAQIFTPHTAPKKIRAMVNKNFIAIRNNPIKMFLFIIVAIISIIFNLVQEILLSSSEKLSICFHRGFVQNTRKMMRLNTRNLMVCFADENFNLIPGKRFEVCDINFSYFKIVSNEEMTKEEFNAVLDFKIRRTGKRKRSRCRCSIFRKVGKMDNVSRKWLYIYSYVPVSELNQFIMDHYVFRLSISNYLHYHISSKGFIKGKIQKPRFSILS